MAFEKTTLNNQAQVTVKVGEINLGTCVTKTGGQITASETKFRPGGLLPELAFAGPTSVENVTIQRVWDQEMRSKFHDLASLVGRANVTVTYQPLDADENPAANSGPPHIYTGKLIRVTPPDADANADDVSLLEIEVSTHGTIG